ncbi:MAG: NusG domain II-containing protein [Oscillospiraceae bacterium]|nr:NusG domain II-containing protein [Oscillospiraceae bacterium]
MTKQIKIILISVILLFLISCVWALRNLRTPEVRKILILQENQVLQEIDLETAEAQEIRIDAPDGGYNLIRIQDHQICIAEADCPDQTCVRAGNLRSEGLPVVCLPHKVIIRFAD